MKVSYENIQVDKNCSFRTLHINQPVNQLTWEYHYHPEVELVCVISGSGIRQVGYHKSNYVQGDLVLIGSNVPHSGFGLNATDPHEEIVIQFKESIVLFPNEVEEANSIKKMLNLAKLGIHYGEEVKQRLLPKLFQLLDTPSSDRYVLLLLILFELANVKSFTLLNKEVMPYSIIARNKDRLQTIFTYIEDNYNKEISIHEVARLVNLTLPAFCSFFKKSTKLTFSSFLNEYRIDKACYLLAQGKTISETCYAVGYNSLSYFCRVFRKCKGMAPTDFIVEIS